MKKFSLKSLRSWHYAVILLAGAGVLLRLEYLWEFAGAPNFDIALGADVMEYDARAKAILAGRFFPRIPDIHGPLYSCFLALIYRLTGYSVPAARIIQLFLNFAAWIALFFLLVRKYRVPEKGGMIFLALAMLYPVPFFHQAELISETLMLPLVALLLWLMTLAGEPGRRLRYTLLLTFAGGAVCGLLNLLHGITLLLTTAIVLVCICRRQGLRLMALLLGVMLTAGSYMAASSSHYGRFTPVQANGAFNFWLGNNPESTGGCYVRPGKAWRQLHREAEKAAEKRNVSVDRIWLERSAGFWLDSPWQGVKLWLRKAYLIFHGSELKTGADPLPAVNYTSLVKYGSGVTLALFIAALYGMWVLRKKYRKYQLFYLIFIAGWLIQLLTVTGGRYRILMLPAVLFFAAAGIFSVNYRRYWWSVSVVVLLSLSGVAGGVVVPRMDMAEYWSLLGEAAWRKGDTDRAEEHLTYASGVIDDPRRFNNLLGAIAEVRGDRKLALNHYDLAIAAEPEAAESWMNRANLLGSDPRQWQEAEKCYRRAFELDPELAVLYYNYGLFEVRRKRDAREYFFRAVELDPRLPGAWNMLGVSALISGKAVMAVEFFRNAADIAPEVIGVWQNLRTAALMSGDRETQRQAERKIDRLSVAKERGQQ